jgi:hypothetical protein
VRDGREPCGLKLELRSGPDAYSHAAGLWNPDAHHLTRQIRFAGLGKVVGIVEHYYLAAAYPIYELGLPWHVSK